MKVLLHGKTGRPTGFSLINRRLIRGLRSRGHSVSVCSMDGAAPPPKFRGIPDVYLFHGDPFDFDHPIGRTNAFFLSWEYRTLPPAWVEQLNRRFDLVLVPSRATAAACRRSGVRRMIRICPAAVDHGEIHPARRPARLQTSKRFRFLHFGGAHERRGTDILLRAYAEEFSADDDVCLILKGFHYDHHRPWLERVIRRCGLHRRGAPELYYRHETLRSVAPLLTAADFGVFPMRAECTGLPVLECIAAGRPVIVTRGTGLDDFCRRANSRFLPATPVEHAGKAQWEPDFAQLKLTMRDAYERGPLPRAARQAIAATVRDFTWDRTVDCAIDAFAEVLARRPPPSRASRRFDDDRPPHVIATLGAAFDLFRTAGRQDPAPLCVLRAAALPARVSADGENRLRQGCGLTARSPSAIDAWQQDGEVALTDRVAVGSRRLAREYRRRGVIPGGRIVNTPPSIPRRRFVAPPRGATRFLFAAAAPLRGGLLPLLRAWGELRLDAELVVVCPADVWGSRRLLSLLVRNPTVTTIGDLTERRVAREIYRCHFAVAPDLQTADVGVVGEAMARGRAAIVSRHHPLAEIITDGVDGFVLRSTSARSLASALASAAALRRRSTAMGRSAHAKARRFDERASLQRLAVAIEKPT